MLQLLRTNNEDDKDDITFKYSSFFHLGRKKIFFGCHYRRLQGNEKEHLHFCKQKEMKAVTVETNSSICTTSKIHDKAANCQIVTIDRIIDAIVAITEQKLMFGIHWRTTVLDSPTAFEIIFKTGDSFTVNLQK